MTYNCISKIMEAESATLGDRTPQGFGDVNTCGKKVPESGVKGDSGEIFTGFYPNLSKLSSREKQYIFGKS